MLGASLRSSLRLRLDLSDAPSTGGLMYFPSVLLRPLFGARLRASGPEASQPEFLDISPELAEERAASQVDSELAVGQNQWDPILG